MDTLNKFPVKKNYSWREPRRVLSVINLTAADFIPSQPKDKFSKFPVIKPKIARRRSEMTLKRAQEQPTWIIHYRDHIERQLKMNRPESSNDFRQQKVTFSFCEFLKKKEIELKKLNELQQKDSPAKYQD